MGLDLGRGFPSIIGRKYHIYMAKSQVKKAIIDDKQLTICRALGAREGPKKVTKLLSCLSIS